MEKELSNSSILEELHQDEEELKREEKRVKRIAILFSFLIIILLFGVSYLIFQSLTSKKPTTTIVNVTAPTVTTSPTASPSSSPKVSITQPSSNTSGQSSVKDYYVNLGSGSNQSTDWADVAGAITTADLGQYANVKEMHFEAFINVPTANGSISVRLLNKTDGYAVWNSEVTLSATKDTTKFVSPSLIYDTTPKLYQVQMKSQLGVFANLVSSRIHVIAK